MNYENYCETPIELRDAGIDSVPEIIIDNDILHASVRNIKTLNENIKILSDMLSTLRNIQRLHYVKLSMADVKYQYRLISIEKNKSEGIILIRVNHRENVWTKIGVEGKIEDIFAIENKIQEIKSYYQGWYDFWTSKTGSLIEPTKKEF
ncbi:MAG TPA: hypothetical protein DHM42_06135 [Clostridiales bacterium]|nr:hypothetical protein [Clostridiales bacterium]